MNEVETKIAEAIKDLERLLVPMAATHDMRNSINESLDVLRESLICAVGRRVIKGSK